MARQTRRSAPALAPASSVGLLDPSSLPPSADLITDPKARLFADPLAAPAIDTFEKILGGREGMIAELLTSPDLTPSIRKVLTLILDPRFNQRSLAYLCSQAGILPGEVFASFRDAVLAKANVHALRIVASKLPAVMQDFMDKAVDREVVCPDCEGTTTVTVQRRGRKGQPDPPPTVEPCGACHATGRVVLEADADRQTLAFELAGLIKKPGMSIAVNQTNNQLNVTPEADSLGGLAQLQQAVSHLLYDRHAPAATDPPPSIDVEVLPDGPS